MRTFDAERLGCVPTQERGNELNGFKEMYAIKGTPGFLLFNRGEEKGRMLGLADKERLETFLARNLPPVSIGPA